MDLAKKKNTFFCGVCVFDHSWPFFFFVCVCAKDLSFSFFLREVKNIFCPIFGLYTTGVEVDRITFLYLSLSLSFFFSFFFPILTLSLSLL